MATIAHTNARLCGQAAGHSNHPRLEIKMTFAKPGRRKELKVKDAMADSGAEMTIFQASLIEASKIQLTGMRKSKVDLRAANKAKIDVQGAAISVLSPSGERFQTTSKIYIVRNVDEVYLSLDVLVDLRIVDKFFLVAGAVNQHRAKAGAWDRTGTVTKQLPHAIQHKSQWKR